jgi:hypothetical protein
LFVAYEITTFSTGLLFSNTSLPVPLFVEASATDVPYVGGGGGMKGKEAYWAA